MKTKRYIKIVFSILSLTFALTMFGQGCKEDNTVSGNPSAQGNGDFYGGIDADEKLVVSEAEDIGKALIDVDIDDLKVSANVDGTSGEAEESGNQDCQLANQRQCVDGSRVASFNACPTDNEFVSLFGNQRLDYSELNCSIEGPGDSFTHNFFLVFVDSRQGNTVTIHSNDHQDYRGTKMGGGEEFRISAENGMVYNLKGKRTQVNAGLLKVDQSQRTPEPLRFSSGRRSDVRRLNGSVETNHNIIKYTSLIEFNNVQFNRGNCCHPIDGSVTMSFTGKNRGEATLHYKTCGTAEIEFRNGRTKQVRLSDCP